MSVIKHFTFMRKDIIDLNISVLKALIKIANKMFYNLVMSRIFEALK